MTVLTLTERKVTIIAVKLCIDLPTKVLINPGHSSSFKVQQRGNFPVKLVTNSSIYSSEASFSAVTVTPSGNICATAAGQTSPICIYCTVRKLQVTYTEVNGTNNNHRYDDI